jgi:hypothetical protein
MCADNAEADAPGCGHRLAQLRTALVFDPSPLVQELAAEALCDLTLIRRVPSEAPQPRPGSEKAALHRFCSLAFPGS